MEHFLQGNSSINCTSLEIFSLLCGPLKAAGYYCLSSGSPYMLGEGLIGYSISKRSVTYNSGLIGWIFFLLPFFWSISPMKLALLEAMLYFLGDKRWPLATGQYRLKSVFPEIRVRTWFQVVSCQKKTGHRLADYLVYQLEACFLEGNYFNSCSDSDLWKKWL